MMKNKQLEAIGSFHLTENGMDTAFLEKAFVKHSTVRKHANAACEERFSFK